MSDMTWTMLPEVDPDNPDELVLDVEGEDEPVVVPATGRPPRI